MKKILLYLLFCFFGATTFAQNTMYIRNYSPRKVRMQTQALPSSGITTTTLTNATYITIPAGSFATPTIYTFTNFNNTAPATLTSQFTQWGRLINGTGATLLTKANAQTLYGPTPVWNSIKFDVINATTNVGIGSGGISRPLSGYYPTSWPCTTPGCTSPGSPITQGTFSATWNGPIAGAGNITYIDFYGTL